MLLVKFFYSMMDLPIIWLNLSFTIVGLYVKISSNSVKNWASFINSIFLALNCVILPLIENAQFSSHVAHLLVCFWKRFKGRFGTNFFKIGQKLKKKSLIARVLDVLLMKLFCVWVGTAAIVASSFFWANFKVHRIWEL